MPPMSALRALHTIPAARRESRRSHLVRLHDGTTVLLRRQTPDDREQIVRLYAQLSSRSRHLRFLCGMPGDIPAGLLDVLSDVDAERHVAVLALHQGRAVGVARCIRDGQRPEEADMAFAVADAFQGRGLGRALVTALRPLAADAGISRLTFDTLGENVAAQALLRSQGALLRAGGGVVSGVLEIAGPQEPGRLAA